MKKLLYSLSFIVVFILSIVSCTKIRTTEIGSDVIPPVDNVTVFDTVLEIQSEIIPLADSTRMRDTGTHALGIMQDPSFGITSGEVYLQLLAQLSSGSPIKQPFGPPDSILGLDSVVLSLRYRSLYGDSNAMENLKVFEIDQSSGFRDSSLGYLISQPSFAANNLLGQKSFTFSSFNDSLIYLRANDTVKTVNEIRIPLDNSFGLRLMSYDSTIYKSDTNFNSQFRGFAIKADEGSAAKRAMAYISLIDGGTRLTFHYRKKVNNAADTVVTEFVFRNKANANLISRNNSGTPYAANLATGTGTNQSELYLQSTPGSVAMLSIPGLSGLSNRLVYRAALIAERLDGLEDNYFNEPSVMFLDAVNTDPGGSGYYTIPKSFITSATNVLKYEPAQFGGILKNNKYEFDLTRYVQGIVTDGDPSYPLRLYAPYITRPVLYGTSTTYTMNIATPVTRGRIIVGGGANTTKKLRLYIVYSRI
ncbi:DUF4270 family protein [Flavihumibacter petaseus]|uniref:DUF4270 family protein n=1 Tax=Flavihumibacter petaseus TaxID=549295 RepID=UPI0014706146|nr:DUF4270 family protein [Flavihumibacter petaseus]